jgi:hypothetical protein
VRNEPKKAVFRFDDIGCLIVWSKALQKRTGARPWWEEPDARAWVADFNLENRETLRWLDARLARYIERTSPMGYNLAAVENSGEGNIGFDEILLRMGAHRHDGNAQEDGR